MLFKVAQSVLSTDSWIQFMCRLEAWIFSLKVTLGLGCIASLESFKEILNEDQLFISALENNKLFWVEICHKNYLPVA